MHRNALEAGESSLSPKKVQTEGDAALVLSKFPRQRPDLLLYPPPDSAKNATIQLISEDRGKRKGAQKILRDSRLWHHSCVSARFALVL